MPRRLALPSLAVLLAGLAVAPLAQGCGDSSGDGVTIIGNQKTLLLVSPPTLPIGRSGTAYAYMLQASGGSPPFTWALLSGTFPQGITLAPGTGQLSGTPTMPGELARARLRVFDQKGAFREDDFLLPIEKELVITTPATLGGARVNLPYLEQLASTGGSLPVTWSVPSTTTLPPGFVLNRLVGHLVGQPTAAGVFTFQLTATDTANEAGQASATKSFTITVAP